MGNKACAASAAAAAVVVVVRSVAAGPVLSMSRRSTLWRRLGWRGDSPSESLVGLWGRFGWLGALLEFSSVEELVSWRCGPRPTGADGVGALWALCPRGKTWLLQLCSSCEVLDLLGASLEVLHATRWTPPPPCACRSLGGCWQPARTVLSVQDLVWLSSVEVLVEPSRCCSSGAFPQKQPCLVVQGLLVLAAGGLPAPSR